MGGMCIERNMLLPDCRSQAQSSLLITGCPGVMANPTTHALSASHGLATLWKKRQDCFTYGCYTIPAVLLDFKDPWEVRCPTQHNESKGKVLHD